MMRLNHLIYLIAFILPTLSWAAPESLNFQAYIKKPDNTPLQESSVNFRIKYQNPAGNCTIYTEDFLNVSMANSNGNISLPLGSGSQIFPAPSSGVTLSQTFSNNPTAAFACAEGGTFSPTDSSRRVLSVEFIYSGVSTQRLSNIEINAVPYAMHASESQNSLKLGGVAASLYTQFGDFQTCTGGKFLTYDGQYFTCQTPAVSNFSGNLAGDVTGAQGSTVVEKLRGKPISATAPTTGQYLKFDGTNWVPQSLSLTGGTVTAVSSANSYLTVTNPNDTPSLTLNVGTAANTVAAGDDSRITGAFQASTSLSGDLSGTLPSATVATVGTKTATEISNSVADTAGATSAATASKLVKRDSSGNSSFSTASATNFSGRNFLFFEPTDTYKVSVTANSSLTTNYTLTLPTTAGSTGQVLSTDGSGLTSWITPNAGTVTSVGATAPIYNSGTASAPVLYMTTANGTTNGYLTSANWTTFNNKLGTSTPHSGDVSGTYNAMSVDKIKGTAVTITSLTSGNYLKYNGTAWVNSTPAIGDVTNLTSSLSTITTNVSNLTTAVNNKIDQSQMPAACNTGEIVNFFSPSGTWVCTPIVIDPNSQLASAIRPGSLAREILKYDDGSKAMDDDKQVKELGENGTTIHYTDLNFNNKGLITLPPIGDVPAGWYITIVRDSGTNLAINTKDGTPLLNGSATLEPHRLNLSSVTIVNMSDKNNFVWKIKNEVPDCYVGKPCGAEKNIYLGLLNNSQYFTTPGGCDHHSDCNGGDDFEIMQWADTSGNSAYNTVVGANKSNDGKDQAQNLAQSYDDTQVFKVCDDMDFSHHGVTLNDWYLPTMAEFDLLLQNKANIEGFLTNFDSSNTYWVSLEVDGTRALKWKQDGYNYRAEDKADPAKFRCVRRW